MNKHQPEASKSKHGMTDDTNNLGNTTTQHNPTEPLGLKRRHFMGTALALDAAALLAACGGGGGGGDAAGSGSGSSSGSTSSSASGSGSGSGSSSGSGSAAPTNWVVSTLAGTGATTPFTDGTGGTAIFNTSYGVAVDTSGNVYVADTSNNRIRKITPVGVVSTFAGTGGTGAANGTGETATFNNPTGVAVDTSGNVYVADYSNNQIRKITSFGVTSTFAGGGWAGDTDGTAATAAFNGPAGIAVDNSGNVYVADFNNQLIRQISPVGVVSKLAGMAGSMGANNGTGTTARFHYPRGVAVDTIGNVYVADKNNHQIRIISRAGVVGTLVGLGAANPGSQDGTGGTATFNNPYGVTVDTNGNLYVADQLNNRIRKINSAGVVSTIAGSGGASGYLDGSSETAKFNLPASVAVDTVGNVYVADRDNHRIRKITPIYP